MEVQETQLRTEKKKAEEFLAFLHVEFARRKTKNASYSLRAFARTLDVDQSLLSKILRGQRNLSEQMIFKMALTLQIPEADIRQYLTDGRAKENPSKYRKLKEDELNVISDWQPFAILELAQTQGFQTNPAWIAARLGVVERDVEFGISKLIYNRLLKIEDNGAWTILSVANTWTDTKVTTLARKRLQKQLLSKAEVAIEKFDLGIRENLSMTIAVNPAALGEVKRRIHSFNEDLRHFINSFETQEEVYQVLISFFPLTEQKKEIV